MNLIDPFGLTESESSYYNLGFSDGKGDGIPISINILGQTIDTAYIVGLVEIVLGVGAIATAAVEIVATEGIVSPAAAGQVVLGVQLIGVGIGTLATKDVVPVGPLFTPAVAY